MAKTDWRLTDVVKPEDMNNLGQEINDLRSDLSNIDVPPASLTMPGIVQLSNATDSEAEDRAATPKAVKEAYDRGSEGIEAAVNAQVASDLLASTVAAQLADTMYQTATGTATALIVPMSTLTDGYSKTFIASANNNGAATTINGKNLYKPNIQVAPTLIAGKAYTIWYRQASDCFFIKASAEGTATTAQVLAGVPFSNESDTGLIGTMPNNGTQSATLTTQGATKTIPAGYSSGGTITANITNLTADKIVKPNVVGGVTGVADEIIDIRAALDSMKSQSNYSRSCTMYLHPNFYRVECAGNVVKIKKFSLSMVQLEERTLHTFNIVDRYLSDVSNFNSPHSIGLGYDISWNSYGQSVVINVNGVILASSSTYSMRGYSSYAFKNGNHICVNTYGVYIYDLNGTILAQSSYGDGYTSGRLEGVISYGNIVYMHISYLETNGTTRYASFYRITPTTITKITDSNVGLWFPMILSGVQNYMN
ncbi:MAG TPA: phage tail protein [Paenibacillus sp.]